MKIKLNIWYCFCSRFDRLSALQGLKLAHVTRYASKFKLLHATEALFYGNLDQAQANAMATLVIEARKNHLERFVEESGVEVERNEYLEEWFIKNPVERIVALEGAVKDHWEKARHERKVSTLGRFR